MSVEVKVEFSDVSRDSQAWEASGGKLREAGTAASALDLPNEAFMMAGYGFAQVYRSFLRKFEIHVTGGSQESEQVAGVLEGPSRVTWKPKKRSSRRFAQLSQTSTGNGSRFMNTQASHAMVTLTKRSSEIDNVASAINTAISLVPPILRGMLEDVYAKWNEFLALAREFFDRVAEAYAHAIEDHADAVQELKSSVKTMSRALTDHAQSIDDFWSNIGNGFVNFLLSLAGVAVSIVGLIPPFTVAGIIGLVLSIISCVKSIYDLVSTEISDLERFAEVAKRLGEDGTEQYSESWPKLTAGNGVRV